MSNDKVARLRQLMSEAVPRSGVPPTAEDNIKRQFRLYEFNADPAPCIEQTPRARNERDIHRITRWYGWNDVVLRSLDRARVTSLQGLNDDDLAELHARMKRLEECVQQGLDAPDSPPAR